MDTKMVWLSKSLVIKKTTSDTEKDAPGEKYSKVINLILKMTDDILQNAAYKPIDLYNSKGLFDGLIYDEAWG